MNIPDPRQSSLLLGAAAFVIVVAGAKAASNLIVNLLLAVFVAIVVAPVVTAMERRRIPTAIAVVLVIVGVLAAMLGLGALLGTSVAEFTDSLPTYEAKLREVARQAVSGLSRIGIELSPAAFSDLVNAGRMLKLTANMLTVMGNMVTNTFLILLVSVFLLLEAADFPLKMRASVRRAPAMLEQFRQFTLTLERYLVIKTLVSLATGVLAGLLTGLAGVDFPFLWGTLAFLLNYVPNIGSIIAAIPAVTLALVQLGPGHALVVAAGYALINVAMGSVLEPRIMGRGLGLSALVVLLSLIFWGWVFGPVGMVLSVPLTISVKILLDASPETRWAALLLGPAADARAVLERREGQGDSRAGRAAPDTVAD